VSIHDKCRTLLNRIFPPLKGHEVKILEAVCSALPQEASALLKTQIDQVNYVQRLAGGKEVNLYSMRDGQAKFSRKSRFPNSSEEAKLAVVTLKDGAGKVIRLSVWMCNGHIFSLEYNQSPQVSKHSEIEILNVTVVTDPMRKEQQEWRSGTIESWVNDYLIGKSISLRNPISRDEIERCNHEGLPEDYLDILRQANGIKSDSLILLGIDLVRNLELPNDEGVYQIFAELPDKGVLAIQKASSSGDIFFIDFEDNEATKVGKTLRQALSATTGNAR
jgi:hypothetical protein